MDQLAITGTTAQARAALDRLAETGTDAAVLVPAGPDPLAALDRLAGVL